MENTIYNSCFSIKQFAQEFNCLHYADDVAIAYINPGNVNQFNKIADDMFLTTSRESVECTILIIGGEITTIIDYVTYNIGKSYLLHLHPLKIITKIQVSNDFSGILLINSRAILDDTIINRKPPVSIAQILASNRSPYRKLSTAEANVIKNCIKHIEYYIPQPEHRLKKELLCSTLYILVLESAKIIFDNAPAPNRHDNSTKKTYIEKFIKLLTEHATKEHNPAFYADKLCISIQYLSLILKEVSGKTTNAWIAGFLITRAKVMLRNPETTIQQITEALNFSDQSSFGKFFKKHTGISPKKYKEEH